MENLQFSQNELESLAESLGLSLDNKTFVISGNYQHYKVYLEKFNKDGHAFTVVFTLSQSGKKPQVDVLEKVNQEMKAIGRCLVNNYQVSYKIHDTIRIGDLNENVKNLLDVLTNFFAKNNLETSCYLCGKRDNTDFLVNTNGASVALCTNCSTKQLGSSFTRYTSEDEVSENWLMGTLGAFLGSLIGVATQLIISMMGFVSAFSGIVMAVCALRGYERFGKRISKKGIFIVVIVLIVMVFVGSMLDTSILIAGELNGELSTFQVFIHLFELFDAVPELRGAFYQDLMVTYLFTLFGGVPTIRDVAKRNKAVMNNACKLKS